MHEGLVCVWVVTPLPPLWPSSHGSGLVRVVCACGPTGGGESALRAFRLCVALRGRHGAEGAGGSDAAPPEQWPDVAHVALAAPEFRHVFEDGPRFQGRELQGDEEVSSLGLLEPGASLTALLVAPLKALLRRSLPTWQVITVSADGKAKLFDVESGAANRAA